jgi:hypothetical protein
VSQFRIHRNLHSKTWTIQHKIPGVGWRKLASAESIYAPSVTFTVSEAGRVRARNERRKNVHAFAVVDQFFTEEDWIHDILRECDNVITYSPFNSYGFTTRHIPTSQAVDNVTSATMACFAPSGRIYAYQVDGQPTSVGCEQLTLEQELGVMRIAVHT